MEKYFLRSKTLWGAVVVLLAAFNVNVPVSDEEVSSFLDSLQAVVGFVLVVWGRVTASGPVGFK